MKLRNFFLTVLAAAFTFAACEKPTPSTPETGETAKFAGNWWLMVTVDGAEKVVMPASSDSYLSVADAIMVENEPLSIADNIFTFAAVEGGYTIKTQAAKYVYNGPYNEGWSNKFSFSSDLPEKAGVWTVEEKADGTVKITNTESENCVQYDSQYKTLSLKPASEGAVLPKLVKADNPVETPTMVWTPGEKFYAEEATINGTAGVDVVKLGTSSVVGSGKITIPAGTQKLSFYGVAWKGKSGSVTITGTGVSKTFDFVSNNGAANNSPYTITAADTDKYELTFSPALAANTELTFASVSGKTRVIMWGFTAE